MFRGKIQKIFTLTRLNSTLAIDMTSRSCVDVKNRPNKCNLCMHSNTMTVTLRFKIVSVVS
jgi:hypothetical protein